MAKQRRQLNNAFEQLSGNEGENTPMNPVEATNPTNNEVVEEAPQNATETAPEGSQEVLEEVEENSTTTVKSVAERLQQKYQEKVSKPTVEDTHIRTTFLFRKDLAKRLDRLSKNKRGFKTAFINEAIEALLNEYE
ncbi:hypothetical protein [Bacillus sp. UNC41MFS5]|uniref:hypothetical protein n=1 Tax=Bacillus sp. UNC41MFS5 TaxID=1449046 RepID=UPI00068D27C6|nr:hypothetical protein [Bacillus sp. UNC41MFS5]